jgi:MFS family permease
VNATLDVLSHGLAYPLGALLAAFIAEQIGVRGAIAVGWAGMALSILFVIFSPVPGLRSAADFLATQPADAVPSRATR